MIQIVNIHKKFRKKVVLDAVTINIQAGNIVGVLGPNSSGKSTLLRLIAGILAPDSGYVAYKEQMIFNNTAAKQDIFLVGDDPHFLSKASIRDMTHFYKVFYQNFDDNRFATLLQAFGMSETMILSSFSKGLKRQIALIFGLSVQTPVLILDETFDGLDPIMFHRVKSLLLDDVKHLQRTIIISSHNLEAVSNICDSLIIIDNHKVRFTYDFEQCNTLYHKFHVTFSEPQDASIFSELDCISINGCSRSFTLVVRGNQSDIKESIMKHKPSLLESDTVNIDQVFMAKRGGHR